MPFPVIRFSHNHVFILADSSGHPWKQVSVLIEINMKIDIERHSSEPLHTIIAFQSFKERPRPRSIHIHCDNGGRRIHVVKSDESILNVLRWWLQTCYMH